ncbi:hypothetical protein GCM10011611_27370 [Aliidongia dinghuensis]|uniref:DUF2334 domain-containing protein n=1 Tax=Aliidongia dinghuensis TaxID=1867774 RepID=A0A8J2YVA9_9PROT|nr:DUF2334 domain-containing protein [Aliidongia dinghuensis]GGF19911.1 hypothetical protein GCM10011611_27370 [Aliidongia dinghuensis]
MARDKSLSRRFVLLSGGATLAGAALPHGVAEAAKQGSRPRTRPTYAALDYKHNPFLRPIGGPLSSPRPVSNTVRSGAALVTNTVQSTRSTLSTLAAPLATTAAGTTPSTLILYDTTNTWGWLGELYAIMVANLASHFGTWTAVPVVKYTSGMLNQYSCTIYIGSTYGEPIPTAFLNDVLATTQPVIWAYDNIWQLTAQAANFTAQYGWNWSGFDFSTVAQVNYKGQQLKRYSPNGAGIMNYAVVGSNVSVLATCVRSDSTTFPWALRSGNLTYIGENPLVYISEGDRYIAFCDLLFDALAPATPTQHRALVRLEDIDPTYDPTQLRAAADYLASQGVPFGFQVIPRYLDPNGAYTGGVPQNIPLASMPAVASAFKYMLTKGGAMINHGWTHQYSNIANPFTAVTGDDFEFYRVTQNSDLTLNYQGPLPPDSKAWAMGRFSSAATDLRNAGLAFPSFVTFPGYAASATDYEVANSIFKARAERSLYFSGLLTGAPTDYTRIVGQYFPYVVRDVYGGKVLPDNLGGIEPQAFEIFPARQPADILADAQRNLVVRDGFASFFYHPSDSLSYLQDTVTGLKDMGYTFVAPGSL